MTQAGPAPAFVGCSTAPLAFWAGFAGVVLFAFGLPLSLISVGDLWNETDGQYAAAARGMAEGGSWLVPENNGVPRLNKPPLLVWMMAVAFSLGGVNEAMARLPTALGVGFWVVGVYLLGAAWAGPGRGVLAALMLLTALGTGTLGRLIMPEPWFCAGFTWALWAVWQGMITHGAQRRWGVIFWSAMGLAAAVKGWHGLILPGAIAVLTLLWARRLEPMRGLFFSPVGWGVAGVLTLPWLVLMEIRFPGFLRYFFWDEALGHALGSEATDTSWENVPRSIFLLLHLAWFFPWTLVAAAGVVWGWRQWRWPHGPERLFWVWGGVVLAVTMAAGQRQDYYAMMGWPVFFYFGAWAWEKVICPSVSWSLAGIGAVGLVAYGLFPWWQRFLPSHTAAMADRSTAWKTLAGFDSTVWAGLEQGLGLVSLAMAVAGIGAAFLVTARSGSWGSLRRAAAFACWLAAATVLYYSAAQGMAQVAPWFSHAEMARWILQNRSERSVAFEGASDVGSSLYFYLGHPIYLVQENPQPEFAARVHGHGRGWTITPEELVRRWEAGERIDLVTETLEIPAWSIRHPAVEEVHRQAGQVILQSAVGGH